MRRAVLALLAGLLFSAQNVLPGFPPGIFTNRAAMDAAVSSALACSYSPVLQADYNVAYTGGTPSPAGGTPGYTYSQTGSLPPGITLNTSTGVLSGTDSTDSGGATYAGIQLKVTDSASTVANCGSSFTITVAATLAMTYTPVTTAYQNIAYTGATPSTSGGSTPLVYSISSGTLPTGFSLNTSTGVITGTDSTIQTETGIVLTVTDNIGVAVNSSSFQIAVGYGGPGDVVSGWSAWYGVRAFSNALANAGATTTPVMDVKGNSTGTSCTIYLLGNGTGGLDFSTAGAGSVGHQCLLGATTFCTSTNSFCTATKWYDQTVGLACASGTTCNVISAAGTVLIMPGSCSYPNSASLPCIQNATSGDGFNSSNTFTLNANKQITFSTVANRYSGTGGNDVFIGVPIGQNGIFPDNGVANKWVAVSSGSSYAATAATDAAWHAGNIILASNNCVLNVDGTETSTGSCTAPNNSANDIRVVYVAASSLTLQEAEAGFLDNYLASQAVRTGVCANQANYYGTTAGTYC